MRLRAKITHLIEQIRFLLLFASDIIHVSELKDGVRLASQAGRAFAEAIVYGKVLERAVVKAVLRKASLQFLIRSLKGLEGDKATNDTIELTFDAQTLRAAPPARPAWKMIVPLTAPTEDLDIPAEWDERVTFFMPEVGGQLLQALVSPPPTATPEKGVTQLSLAPDLLRFWSFDGRSVTAHEVPIQADGVMEICLPNHVLKQAIQGGLLAGGYVEVCRSGEYVRISRDGRTLVAPVMQPPAFRRILDEVRTAPDKAVMDVNRASLVKLCQTVAGMSSSYLRIAVKNGGAELFDSAQLVPRDVFRVALRGSKKFAVRGNITDQVEGEEDTSCLVDARFLLAALKPFDDLKSIRLTLLGRGTPSLIVVQGKADYPCCIVPTPKLLGEPGPCTVRLKATDHLCQVLSTIQHGVESPAQKWMCLTSWADQLLLTYYIYRKRESDGTQFPVSWGEFEVDGEVHDPQVIPLSASLVRELLDLAKEAETIELEYGGDEVTVGVAGARRYTETVEMVPLPPLTDLCPEEYYGRCEPKELARAIDEVKYATDCLPGVNNALAIVIDRRTVTVTAGTYTRRARFEFEQEGRTYTAIQALIPKYLASALLPFLLRETGDLHIGGNGQTLFFSGETFTFALYPHLECEVVTHSTYADRPGSRLYLLTQRNVSQIIHAIDAARGNERSPAVRMWYDDQFLHLAYGESEGPALSVPVEIEKGFVRKGPAKAYVLGEDLKQAFLSARAYGDWKSRFYLDVKGRKVVEVGRIGHRRARFEIAQIHHEPFPLRERVDVYAAIGTHFDLIRKSLHDRILTTYHGLPPEIKEQPELFPAYRIEQGLGDCLVMLDNGAFGLREGDPGEVGSQAYIRFLQVNEAEFSQYTMNDAYSDTNAYNREVYVDMARQGLGSCVYVFHLREPFEALEKILNGGYGFTVERIGWGGAAADAAGHRIDYVAQATELIVQSSTDLDAIKIHGFGMTQWSLMQRYPFDSVDSSSLFTWAMHYRVPTPWGILALKPGRPDSAFDHPLHREIEQWVRSLSYRKGAYHVEFSLEALAAETRHALELRQLYGLALYRWLQTSFKYLDHMRREQRFIVQHELEEMGPYIRPETARVARPNTGVLKPIRLTV